MGVGATAGWWRGLKASHLRIKNNEHSWMSLRSNRKRLFRTCVWIWDIPQLCLWSTSICGRDRPQAINGHRQEKPQRNVTSHPKMTLTRSTLQVSTLCLLMLCAQRELHRHWSLKHYLCLHYHIRAELTVVNGLLLRNNRVVIPQSLRPQMLKTLHEKGQNSHLLARNQCRHRQVGHVWSITQNNQKTLW